MERREFLKNAGIAGGMVALSPGISHAMADDEYQLTDLHVHMTPDFTIEHIMEIARKTNIQFGIVEHPADWAIKNDADLKQYIDKLRPYPVYIGLQPINLGWSKHFSTELLSQLDYILMDPQKVPMGNGQEWHIWKFDTYIADTSDFMKRYMDYAMEVLQNEPVTIFGWPLFLPVCIARDYYTLWTQERMQQIITAAKARNIAIEINDMAHTPHEEFINMAKDQGLKFTFGSDARNNIAGRLAYCKRAAKACNLNKQDYYWPERKLNKI